MFQNKTKYTTIVLYAGNIEESRNLQKFVARFNFRWSGNEIGYFKDNIGNSHYLYLKLNTKEILWCDHLDLPYLERERWSNRFYTIKDISNLKCLFDYGQEEPSYKPRKIDRTL